MFLFKIKNCADLCGIKPEFNGLAFAGKSEVEQGVTIVYRVLS